jgi:hypothetical protein
LDNVIIDYRDRPEGSESKLNTYSDGIKVLRTIFRLFKNYKPMQFFSALALVLAIVSAAFFIPVFVAFLQTGVVDKMPTLIVSGFTMIAAIQSLFSGLILATINQKNRHDFEMQLISTTNAFHNKNREG